MPQLLTRDVPEETIAALKLLAKAHHRSLSGEVRAILVSAAEKSQESPYERALRIKARLEAKGGIHSDSGELQAEDRER